MSVATPDIALATYVASQISGLTLGTNVYHCPIGAPEDGFSTKAVFFINTGSAGPASPDNGKTVRLVNGVVQVIVRAAKGDEDYRIGRDLADDVHDEIEHATIAGYINVRNLREPGPLGTDKGGRHLWSWEAELIFEE